MICASCARDNPADARFCMHCAAPLPRRCVQCGIELPAVACFCPQCAHPVAAATAQSPVHAATSVEARKVVTIVFADLAGSTGLHERLDAESTRRLMERYYQALREAIEAHGGTVVKFLGDGVMAAFGVPQVAEDDAVRAVRAAVGMQQAFRELRASNTTALVDVGLRIGINTGEVIVSADNTDVVGDPANVAARLQQEAQDDEVIIGEATRRLVQETVTLEPIGVRSLKGRTETVAAYRVVSLDRPAGAAAVAFVGRDDELRRLLGVYQTAVADSCTRLAMILGSPGLGKTRLLEEVARRVSDGTTVLSARCESAGGATFAPIARAVRVYLRSDLAGGVQIPLLTKEGEDLRAVVAAALPDSAERSRIAAGITALLAGTPAAPEEMFFVVRRFLAALAARQPVVLAVDDLQWAEPLLFDLIEHLVQWGTSMPVLVLAAARPELRDLRSSLTAPGVLAPEVVTLGGLDASAAMRLAANVIGTDVLPAAVAGRVLATSEGNPLFVGELVRMLVHDGALKQDGERWTAAVDLATVDMPPTIHALLAARIERVRAEDRTVLERAAVIGRQFSRAAVAHLLPRDVRDLDARLEALRRSELIEPDTAWFLGEPALRFHHGLTRDAAYRRLLKEIRADLHGRLAEWIEHRVGESIEHDEMIGWHLEQAHQHLRELGPLDATGTALGERAARYLGTAGRRALARDDVSVASDLLGRAVRVLDEANPARADLTLDWCEALLAAGDVAHAKAAIDALGSEIGGRGLALSPQSPNPDPRRSAWHTCFTAQLAVLTNPQALRGTVDALASAASELATLGDVAGEAKAHQVHALALQRMGAIGAAEAVLDKALAAARQVNDRRRSNAVLAGAPEAALWGPSPVTRASGRCLDVVRVLRITQGAPAVEAVALRCQAVLEALRGRSDAARRMITSARKMVEELGITQQVLETDLYSGLIELIEENAAAAERSLSIAYEGFRAHGLGIDAARAGALLGRALLVQGCVADAERLSHESEALAGDDLQAAVAWRWVRAETLAARGEHAAAVEVARTAVEIAAATDALLLHGNARMALAAALRAAGREREATAEDARAIELWEAKGATLLVERTREPLPRPLSNTEGGALPPSLVGRGAKGLGFRRRVRPNAATAAAARLDRAIATRDAAALRAIAAEEGITIDHPNGSTYDAAATLRTRLAMLRAKDLQFQQEALATLGDSLALFRMSMSASGLAGRTVDVGPYARDLIILIDGPGRKNEMFASEHMGDAVAALYARYAESLPDGPERARMLRTAHTIAANIGPLDLDRQAAAMTPALAWLDHRTVGFGTVHGREGFRTALGTLFETADDLVNRIDDILDLRAEGLAVRMVNSGIDRASGGAYERSFLLLLVFGPDGLITRIEQFDVRHEAEALARLDELVGGLDDERPPLPRGDHGGVETPGGKPPPHPLLGKEGEPHRRVRPNAATAVLAASDDVFARRDHEAGALLFSETYVEVHHPTGSTYGAREALTSVQRLMRSNDVSYRVDPLAVLGDRLALGRRRIHSSATGRGRFDVREYEIDTIVLAEADEHGRYARFEVFAADRLGDAIGRLYERYAALLPDDPEHTRAAAIARVVATISEVPDLDRFGANLAPSLECVDHRMLGTWSARGVQEWLEHWRSQLDLTTQISPMRIESVLALEPDAYLVRCAYVGTDRASGGTYENQMLALCVFDSDGLIARLEAFEVDAESEALARFDELYLSEVEGPVAVRFENAATRAAQRMNEAFETLDNERHAALLAPDFRNVDRRRIVSTDLGREEFLESFAFLFARVSRAAVASEVLATRGDRLALLGMSIRVAEPESGPSENAFLQIWETDASGRVAAGVGFDPGDLEAAYAELEERYNAGEGAPFAGRRFDAPINRRDWDAVAELLAPDVVVQDHRRLGWESLHGPAAYVAMLKALIDLAPDARIGVKHLRESERAALLSTTLSGTREGGAFEDPRILVAEFDGERKLCRIDFYDLDQFDVALARFEGLGNPSVSPLGKGRTEEGSLPRIGNAATRAMGRLQDAWASADWARYAALFPPGVRILDRRKMVQLEIDRDQFLDSFRPYFEMTVSTPTFELLATRGERLSLHRAVWTGTDGHSGLSEVDWLAIMEVDEHGEPAAWVALDNDALDAAYAELDQRFDGGEAAAYPHVLKGYQEVEQALTARDWERFTAALSPAVVIEDHRPLGYGAFVGGFRSRDEYEVSFRALLELAPDVTQRVDHVLALDDRGLLAIFRWLGARDGGRFEIPMVIASALGPDGLIQRVDAYSLDQLDEARAHFEELRPDPLRIPPNAATRAGDRWLACIENREWQDLTDLFAPTLVFEDRRRLVRTTGGRDMAIASTREIIDSLGARPFSTLLATAGDRLALHRVLFSAGSQGAQFEVDTLHLTEVDAEGRFVAIVAFDPDDRRAATTEMLDRYARNEAGAHMPPAAVEAAQAMNAHDLGRFRSALSDDFIVDDHRRTGLGKLRSPEEYVAAVAAVYEQAPDIVFEPLYIVAAAQHALLVMQHDFGTLANGGGTFERVYALLSQHKDGRVVRVEFFEPEDIERARTRLEELQTSEGR